MTALNRDSQTYFIMHIRGVPPQDREQRARDFAPLTDEQISNRYRCMLSVWWEDWRAQRQEPARAAKSADEMIEEVIAWAEVPPSDREFVAEKLRRAGAQEVARQFALTKRYRP